MNKLTKIGLTALAGSLMVGTVNAADWSITGTSSMTFSGGDDKATTGNGWSMGDSLTFSASGDVNDIGITVSYELDGQGQGTDTFDDHSISFDLGDAGTLVFAGHGGSSALSARDDVMPTAKEEPWDVVTGADAGIINGAAAENQFNYTYSHDSGFLFNMAYNNADAAANAVSYTDFALEYTGVDGLRVGYAFGDVETTAGTEQEESTMFATYATGGFTVGVQTSENDRSGNTTADTESSGFGISYQVNDDLAVSYGAHSIEYATGDDQEASGFSISYTMGSMALSGAYNSVDNIANTATDDRSAYELGVVFSF